MRIVIGMTTQATARRDQHYRARVLGKWVSFCCAFFVAMLVAGCAGAASSGELDGDASSSAETTVAPTPDPTATPSPTPDPTPFRPPPAGYVFASYWIKSPIVFCVNPDGGPPLENPLLLVAQVAVANWQMAGGGNLPLRVDAECPGVSVREIDGLNVIGWGPLPGPAVGAASPVTDGGGGVVEGAIILDPDDPWTADEKCLLSILLHEFGHHLGLGHQDVGPSVMLARGSCSPHVQPQDEDAVRYLYP